MSLLLAAVVKADLNEVKWLLNEKNAENQIKMINTPNEHGFTPLLHAAKYGYFDIVKLLLEQQSLDLNMTYQAENYLEVEDSGKAALHFAIQHKHPAIAKLLIEKGASIGVPEVSSGWLATHLAAQVGDLETLQLLLKYYPGFLNAKDIHNHTPLILAAINGHLEVVKFLLQQDEIELEVATKCSNTDPDSDITKLDNGKTALHWAILNNEPAIAKLLIEKGASIEATPALLIESLEAAPVLLLRWLPIHLAAQVGDLETLQLILQMNPTHLNATDVHNQTPLTWAAANGHLKIVEFLLEKDGIDLHVATQCFTTNIDNEMAEAIAQEIAKDNNSMTIKANNGKTPLHWTIQNNNPAIAKLLIENGASVNAVTQLGRLPIHFAAQVGDLKTLKLLLVKNPQSLNAKDIYNQTPLLWAAAKGHQEVVEFLLKQNGIELNVVTSISDDPEAGKEHNGKTALHWAIQNNKDPAIAQALIEAGVAINTKTTQSGLFPIHLAVQKNDLSTVKLLLNKDPDLFNAKDVYNHTPLLLASQNNHKEIEQFLKQEQQNRLQSYNQLYANQEKKLAYVKGLAYFISVLTVGIFALPAIILWAYLQKTKVLQKVEMTPAEATKIKDFRRQLLSSTEKPEKNYAKPVKLTESQTDSKIVYYMDAAQAKRHRFFAACVKNDRKSLTVKELLTHLELKDKSLALKSRLKPR